MTRDRHDLLSLARIRYAQVETTTLCNYRCPYCQVAHYHRPRVAMTATQFLHVRSCLRQLPALEKIYLNGYNEPSLDPHLVDRVSLLSALTAQRVLLTNGFGLTREKVRALAAADPAIVFDIHLSAVDPEEYRYLHGIPLNPRFLRRLQEIGESEGPTVLDLRIMVMGQGDERHRENFAAVKAFFRDSSYKIDMDVVHDRAGTIPPPFRQAFQFQRVKGCSLSNRHTDWIHLSATGNWILCCQDYSEDYIFGNIFQEPLEQIAASDRRWQIVAQVLGRGDSNPNFICLSCKYAIS